MPSERLAVYTTVYPGTEKYLAAWYQSVLAQTDSDFDLWIGLDSLSPNDVLACLGARSEDVRMIEAFDSSPAEIRQKAIQVLIKQYPAIIFVDSDDLLYPKRVAAARDALRHHDVVGCALRIIDEQGHDLGVALEPPADQDITTMLPRYNVFGLSNTAYRSDVLSECLPIASDCVCIDWLLATRAWAVGADMHFDHTAHMAYRQYGANIARVLLPFDDVQVLKATERVLNHYRCALNQEWELPNAHRAALVDACDRTQRFNKTITESSHALQQYVESLNKLSPQYIWWWCVAHPELEYIWKN